MADDIVTRLTDHDYSYCTDSEFGQRCEFCDGIDMHQKAADEITRLRALSDQLAEALRDVHCTARHHAVCWCSTDSEYPADCDAIAALAAYEAARKEADRG